MTERDAVFQSPTPVTVASMRAELAELGVTPGMSLLVHSSLSALGWVSGGAQAVVLGLQGAVGPTGTLMLPAFSTGLSDPAYWQAPPVPEAWWPIVRETMPAYDPETTPTRGVGAIPECFRNFPGVRRSAHPHCSFAAWGARAGDLVGAHPLDYCFGEASPLARLYDADGWVLLLGVGHDRNTSLHLAEARGNYAGKEIAHNGAPVAVDGERRWVTLEDWAYDSDDFAAIGEAFGRATGAVRSGRVGRAPCMLMPQRALVDFAVGWLETHRR